MTASRLRHHAARVAAVSTVLLTAAGAALVGCSSGQVTQTSSQVASVPGINVTAGAGPNGGGSVALRNVMFAYLSPEGFPVGGKAPLIVRLFNQTGAPIKLTSVEASEFGTVVLTKDGGESVGDSPAPTPGPSETAGASKPPAGAKTFTVEIPAHGYTELVPGEGSYLQIADLTRKIAPGDLVPVTFSFSDGASATLKVSTAPPSVPAPRSPLPLEEGHE